MSWDNIRPIDQEITASLVKFFFPKQTFFKGDTGQCPTCEGHGRLYQKPRRGGNWTICPSCNGDGWKRG